MNTRMSETSPNPPPPEGTSRKTMLTHKRAAGETGEVQNPSITLHAALARANQSTFKGVMSGADDLYQPAETEGMAPESAKSSLPRAMARANDSRAPGNSRMPHERMPPAPAPSIFGLVFNFEEFCDGIHPMRGWWLAFPLLLVSGFFWVHLPAGAPLPAHPAPGLLLGGEGHIWTALLLRDFGMGLLLVLSSLTLVQLIYMLAGKGRPPLVWTLKVLSYALLPLTLVRLLYFLQRLEPGLEVYFRGYVPHSLRFWYLVLMAFASAWCALRLAQAANSRHCQARFPAVLRIFLILPVLVSFLVWVHPLERLRYPKSLRAEVEWARKAADEGNSVQILKRWASVVNGAGALPFAVKSDLYLQRGEAAWQRGEILAAREDFLRLYRMYPERHALRRFGLASTRLIQGQVEEGSADLQVLSEADASDPLYCRWSCYVFLGRFGTEADLPSAERWAQKAWLMDPSPRHGALLLEAQFLQGKDRAVVRFVNEHETALVFPPAALLRAAFSALRADRETEARRWAQDAWEADPSLREHPFSEALKAAGITSRP